VDLDLADDKRMEAWREFCDKFWELPPRSEYIYQCGAGVGTFHIDPYGQMSVCIASRVPSYDLRHGTFRDVWHEFIPQVRTQKWTRETPCRNCQLISLCSVCPGITQIETGDLESPVEYLCQIARLRADAFGLSSNLQARGSSNAENKNNQTTLLQADTGKSSTDS
jgi:radical SAM protein with 4Fe4S-binding SPASM domain